MQYTFITGEPNQPMAPASVEWKIGNGINTGMNVLAGYDYLYDLGSGENRIPPDSQVNGVEDVFLAAIDWLIGTVPIPVLESRDCTFQSAFLTASRRC